MQFERRVVDDVAKQGPRVRDDRDAVLVQLGDESLGSEPAGQRDTGATDHRPAEADQQPGLVVQRREAIDRVSAAQSGRRGGSERRQRPAVVGDLLGDELTAGGAEPDERDVPRVARVRPVPRRELDGVRVDLLHVDDVGVIGQVKVAGFTATEDQDLFGQLARRLEIGGVGDDLRHSPEPDLGSQVGVGLQQHRDGAQPG